VVRVVPDLDRSAPGRGAWLHRDGQCAELAQRRRAYARALKVPGPVDSAAVSALIGTFELLGKTDGQEPARRPESEHKSNGHSMKHQK
jgi:predicted RNA-binding protein YlxR (DUF448 family)